MDCARAFSTSKSRFPLLQSAIHHPLRPIAFRLRQRWPAAGVAKCEFGGSGAPLEPRSPAGRRLSGVLLNDRDGFRSAARKELERLAAERDEAVARLQINRASDEAYLHRRIAELKKHECQVAVEDIMYSLILHEFYQIHVYLVPKLSKCVCNGRLEILPSKDWELESMHSAEVLEMVREHISSIIGCRASSCIKENWATTRIQQSCLCKVYAASILFGYFLKSVSLRHRLEWACSRLPVPLGSQYIGGPQGSNPKGRVSCQAARRRENLRCYVMAFGQETIRMCAKPKSKEAVDVIERQSRVLFGDPGLVITTSFASVKRLMLEAVAFGGFLWDAEEWMNGVYMLEEN